MVYHFEAAKLPGAEEARETVEHYVDVIQGNGIGNYDELVVLADDPRSNLALAASKLILDRCPQLPADADGEPRSMAEFVETGKREKFTAKTVFDSLESRSLIVLNTKKSNRIRHSRETESELSIRKNSITTGLIKITTGKSIDYFNMDDLDLRINRDLQGHDEDRILAGFLEHSAELMKRLLKS